MKRYLAKELIIIEGGEEKKLSLQYVDITDKKLSYHPFDKERAGYLFYTSISIKLHSDFGYPEIIDFKL